MPKFLFVYHGGSAPQSEEEGARVMQAWQQWMGGLGEAVIDGGAPVGLSNTVSTGGVEGNGGANPASGYGIFSAADQAAANEMASGCPILESGGTVEVAEIMQM